MVKLSQVNKTVFVLAHNIRSLYNVGSIFRGADALGVEKLYFSGYTGTPPDQRISKVALGAEDYVSWEKVSSPARLITKLRKNIPGLQVIALENNVKFPIKKLHEFQAYFPLLLVVGEETIGIPQPVLKKCDHIIEIPMVGQKESLNVSVALGIAIYYLKNS